MLLFGTSPFLFLDIRRPESDFFCNSQKYSCLQKELIGPFWSYSKNMSKQKELSDLLSSGLNRSVLPTFLVTLLRLYKQNPSKDLFSDAVSALGLSPDLAQKVYFYISYNINHLENETKKETSEDSVVNHFGLRNSSKSTQKLPKRVLLTVDFEDELEPPDDGEVVTGSSKTKRLMFKKIRKETARTIKGFSKLESVSTPDTTVSKEVSKDYLGSLGKMKNVDEVSNSQPGEEEYSAGEEMSQVDALNSDDPDEIENDRTWYTKDDFSGAIVDLYSDLTYNTRTNSNVRWNIGSNRSGGSFDASGAYVDYDHEDNFNQQRITILPHFIVPTFLRGNEDYLKLQLDLSRTTRSLGPSVNPIKDPESELAVSARNASFAVKSWKQKKERAQQTKDRIGKDSSANEIKVTVHEPEKEENEYSFEEIQKQRKDLPAFKAKDGLLRVVAENQIVVVIGETGSGKTTQLTQFLVEDGYATGNKQIACTQPRRVAAMSVAKRVSEEMGVKLGQEVGYSIRFEDKTTPEKTIIKYMTEGILLREILEDPNLEKYSCVIMDEAHERSLNTDVLLGLFKQLVRRRRDLKLIITSATMNADRFTQFFGNAPQFFISGRTFPVEIFFAKVACSDYVETAVKQVITIHLANTRSDGDVLVFMTGQEDIEATCELIKEKLDLLENPPPLDVYPIYSTLPADIQKRIFTKKNAERRKVVVATNIAETSLTVDGVKYVVDCGLVKLKLFNPKLGMDVLQMVPISLANAQQRSGRAGRTAAGLAYRLYTERAAHAEEMYLQPIPEIQRANLSSVMLLLKSLRVKDVAKFPFLDPPPPDLLYCSLYELWAMGAIDSQGQLTEMGLKMTLFPLEPTLAKLIILSSHPSFSCSLDIISIVSMLSVPNVFYRPKERAEEADLAREKFLIAELDHLTLLNVCTQWEQRMAAGKQNKLTEWCKKNFLQARSLLRARDVRKQLHAIMKKNGFALLRAKSDSDIRRCVCAAYFHQLAKLARMGGSGRGQTEYVNLRQPYIKMYLHPTSALIGGRELSPPFVVYDELVLIKKEYIQCATAVEPEWLLEYGQVFYGVSAQAQKNLQKTLPFKIMDKSDWDKQMEEEKTHEARVIIKSNDKKSRSFKAF